MSIEIAFLVSFDNRIHKVGRVYIYCCDYYISCFVYTVYQRERNHPQHAGKMYRRVMKIEFKRFEFKEWFLSATRIIRLN